MREESGPVVHPQMLWGWTRVDSSDHPGVRGLYDGAPDLGWEADPRLCLYKSDRDQAVILVRLEADGEYRTVIRRELSADERLLGGDNDTQLLGPQSINALIQRLIAHDHRRGFDPNIVIANNEAIHAMHEKHLDEWISEEMAPKVAWHIQRLYLPGIDTAPRLAPSRR